jgi:hypothetical protein
VFPSASFKLKAGAFFPTESSFSIVVSPFLRKI